MTKLLIILLICISISAEGKEKETWEQLRGGVKMLTEYRYVVNEKDAANKSGPPQKTICLFNEHGKLLLRVEYFKGSNCSEGITTIPTSIEDACIHELETFEYSKNGNVVSNRFYRGGKEFQQNWQKTYKYDAKGKRTEELYLDLRDSVHSYKGTYKYDDKGNNIELYQKHLTWSEWKKFVYSYDNKGKHDRRRYLLER